ncbi:MAG: preprotein translocase subunit SecG [Fusobacteriaceae bacterium]|jgi:preprotein translocase subunit SecG|nr:preprotein translocase subunit SecG [Fusobacteriaceae bacterium]
MRLSALFTLIVFVSALLLIILVLIQPDRSNGMSGSIGIGGSNSVFGLSKDGGPLAKITKIVAIVFIVSALLLYLVKV